jgi:hypothetical protein
MLRCEPPDPRLVYTQFQGATSKEFLRSRRMVLILTEEEIQKLAWNNLIVVLSRYLGKEAQLIQISIFLSQITCYLHNVSIIDDELEYGASEGLFSLTKVIAVSMRNKTYIVLTQDVMVI